MGRLDGRVALVTGGGRGIGRSIALALGRDGAQVAVASRTRAELDAVVAELAEVGSTGLAVVADMMDRSGITAMVEEVADHFGRLDVLVNNAGGVVGAYDRLGHLDHDDQLFEDNLFLNLTSAHYATRAALARMVPQGWGRIISIGSGYAKNGGGPLAYSAAKHGLVGFTRALAYPAAAHGITVNCLCPGWTRTGLTELPGVGVPEQLLRKAASDNVQHRMLEPDELGPMAALLASDDGAGITGQVISVDGGFMV